MIITINAHFHCCEHAMRDLSFMFFMVNQRMSRDHSLALAVPVCTAGRASSGNYKWFTARFFGGVKNCTRALKAIDKFLHMPVMCQLDFQTRMNEWILHVFQAIYRTSPITGKWTTPGELRRLDKKQHGSLIYNHWYNKRFVKIRNPDSVKLQKCTAVRGLAVSQEKSDAKDFY